MTRVRLVLGIIVAIAAIALGVGALLAGGDDDGGSGGDGVEVALSGPCADLHSGHNAMMWDSTMADEMVDLDCGWPYAPFGVEDPGGAPDPAFDAAPFEPHLYADLWSAFSSLAATCTIGHVPGGQDGLVFGFRYSLDTEVCDESGGDLVVEAREYVSRPARDAAANEAPAPAVVLGRWVLDVAGPGDAEAAVVAALEEMGGVAVGTGGG